MDPTNFGYGISKARGIDLDTNNFEFAEQLIKKEPSVSLCIGCGGCTATCPAGNLTPFNLRQIHLMIRRGEYNGIRKEADKCMLCGKCIQVCVRGVNTRNIIIAVRALL